MALLIASLVARGSMLVFRYIAALRLTIEDYGLLSIYISLFLSMASLSSFGIGGTLAKLAVKKDKIQTEVDPLYCNAILLTSFTTLIAICSFAVVLNMSAPKLTSARILSVTGLGFLLWSYFQVSIGFSLARFKFALVAIYEAGDGFFKLALAAAVALIWDFSKPESFVLCFCLAYVFLFALSLYFNSNTIGISIFINYIKCFDWVVLKKITSHSFALMLISFVNLLYGFLLRFFLSGTSNSDVAIFDMAITLYSIPKMIFAALVRPVIPYAAVNSTQKISVPRLDRFLILFLASMTLLIYLDSSGHMDRLFSVVGLGAYAKAFPLFILLLIGSPFDLCFGFLSGYFQGAGKVDTLCKITIGVFFLTLPVSYFAVTSYGIYGATITNVVFVLFLAVITTGFAQRLIGFKRSESFSREVV